MGPMGWDCPIPPGALVSMINKNYKKFDSNYYFIIWRNRDRLLILVQNHKI